MKPTFEALEQRRYLAADWQNPLLNTDVDDDGVVAPLDALKVINQISRNLRGTPIDLNSPIGNQPYFDTNGNGKLTPLDALLVINYIARRGNQSAIQLALKNDTGISSIDQITNDPRVAGSMPSALATDMTIKARINRGPIVDIAIGSDGKFAFEPNAEKGLKEGSLNVKFLSEESGVKKLSRLKFVLDTIAPSVSEPKLLTADDTGVSDSDQITRISQPRVLLNAEAGARVTLKVDDEIVYNDEATTAPIPLSKPFSDGTWSLSVLASDIAGNVTTGRQTSFTIDTTAPLAPAFDFAPTSDSGALGDRKTDYAKVTLSGTTESNSFVVVSGTSEKVRTSGDGSFRVPEFALNVGRNRVALAVTDLAGNSSTAEAEFIRSENSLAVDPVLRWNQAILESIKLDATAPPVATRGMAMMSIAMLDVINAIEKTPSYLVSLQPPQSLSTSAAVSTAAHEVLKYLYPAQQATLDTVQTGILAGVTDNAAKTSGIAFGKLVADAVIALRKRDGWDRFVDYLPSDGPGQWQQTSPMFEPAVLPQWGELEPFGVTDIDSLLPSGPPSLTSEQWATAYNDVKSLGSAKSTTRTADQTQQARFWADGAGTVTPPGIGIRLHLKLLKTKASV